MKVSYNWLKDYVDLKLDPKKLAHLFTMAGLSVASCKSIGGDYILEIEVTANRPDCLSVLGVAREAAVLLGTRFNTPESLKNNIPSVRAKENMPEIRIDDPDLCLRYSARCIKDVEVGTSPEWLKERIISCGLRPVNNVVDITNFVLLETGQPMHAFDLDKIKREIHARRAKKGEKIITLDNVARTCDPNTLVIADEERPIAIAGVMGGLETEVNGMTKNILLESAYFNPISIRRTSRSLGVSSESSYRFERRIDNEMVVKASNRASILIKEICSGRILSFKDVGNKKTYSKNITLDLKKIDSLLGINIKKNDVVKILKGLGFQVKGKKTKAIMVTTPSFREDVKNNVDLTEEIARIHGYENIPHTIPPITGNVKIRSSESEIKEKIREVLIRSGLNEIITYGLISRNSIKELDIPEKEIIPIKNPLSIDQEIMRPSLLPGMLKVISHNLNRKAKRLSLFEIGKMYKDKETSYCEEPVVALALAGIKVEDWKAHKTEFDFFDIKGIIERLSEKLGLDTILFRNRDIAWLESNGGSVAETKGKIMAAFGEVNRKICDEFGIEKKVFYGEFYINNVLNALRLFRRYAPYSKYPSITRDISVIADNNIASQDIVGIIKAIGKKIIKEISLIDCYKGKQIPKDKRGLLYRIEYRSDEKTLEDREIEGIHSEIKKSLSDKLNVSFR